MSISQDQQELERLNAIRKALDSMNSDGRSDSDKDKVATATDATDVEPWAESPAPEVVDRPASATTGASAVEPVAEDQQEANGRTPSGRLLKPWEKLERGRVVQFRPQSQRELDEEQWRLFAERQQAQDAEFERKVRAAIREAQDAADREEKRREHEQRTGMRKLRDPNRISLEEAQRRGLIGQSSEDAAYERECMDNFTMIRSRSNKLWNGTFGG
jgi:hypothetical protein